MKKKKTQSKRILDTFVTSIILIFSATLVASGIAISKINTDYMETGIRAGKIVAERANRQISVTTHEGLQITGESDPEVIDKIMRFIPPPVNTTYIVFQEIKEMVRNSNSES